MSHSKRHHNWARGCHNKKRYHDAEDAKGARLSCERKRPGTVLRIYECPHCRGFHLSSSHTESRRAPQRGLGGAE